MWIALIEMSIQIKRFKRLKEFKQNPLDLEAAIQKVHQEEDEKFSQQSDHGDVLGELRLVLFLKKQRRRVMAQTQGLIHIKENSGASIQT